MRTIAIINQKGGCGKTITAVNLSAFLARSSRRVLLIDMDSQGHATLGLIKDASHIQKTIYDALTGDQEAVSLPEVIVNIGENLDLVPADIMLAALPEELAGVAGQENRLSEALAEVREDYDYILIDCPPGVGPLTFNALKACTEAIIPVEPSFFSLHGIGMQLETLDLLARKAGHEIDAHALITLYRGRYDFVKAVAEEIRKHLGDRSFKTFIRFSMKLSEAAAHGLPVAVFSPRSAGCRDYRALATEILEQESQAFRLAASERMAREEARAAPPAWVDSGVLFTLDAPAAKCVQLAGDFNGWAPGGNEMELRGNVWSKVVQLGPGRYQYRFVVDGNWLSDPLNKDADPAPWGGFNSVVVLKEDQDDSDTKVEMHGFE